MLATSVYDIRTFCPVRARGIPFMALVAMGAESWWESGKPKDFSYRVSYEEPVACGGLLASDGGSVYLGSWPFGPARKTPNHRDTNFVQTKNGFLDHSWNFRNWWVDRRIGGHLVSFNHERTFAVRMKGFAHRWEYRASLHKPGTPFELVAQSKAIPNDYFTLKSTRSGLKETSSDWVREIPVVGEAMTLTAKAVFVAGAPATADAHAGLLLAYSLGTGELLAEQSLDGPPVFDGMAVAADRIYLSRKDGKLVCFAGKQK